MPFRVSVSIIQRTLVFDVLHDDSTSRWANRISHLSGSLALKALLIGVHCKKRYINV